MAHRPLDNVRVLDFSQALSGPFCSTLLADLGADVIKVEPPKGGSQRQMSGGVYRPIVMHNKRSAVINLKHEASMDMITELVKSADVLLHNYTTGTMEELGLGYESVQKYNEEIIYASLTGYGESGPYKDRKAFDPLAQAMSGLMWNTGEPDGKPSRIGGSTIDVGTAMLTAFGIMVGLWNRERTGEGQKIETSLFETAAMYVSYFYTRHHQGEKLPTRQGHTWDSYQPVGAFYTADKPVYLSIPYPGLWEQFCGAIDREEWIDDPRFATDEARIENSEILHEKIEETFTNYTRGELVDLLTDAGVPIAELQTLEEASNDEHLHYRDTLTTTEDTDGTEKLIGANPIHFSKTPSRIDTSPPEVGEHTREVLSEHGFTRREIDEFVDEGAAYE